MFTSLDNNAPSELVTELRLLRGHPRPESSFSLVRAFRLVIAPWIIVLSVATPAYSVDAFEGLFGDFAVRQLWGEAKFHEIINKLYPDFQAKKEQSSFLLLILAEALYEAREFRKVFQVLAKVDEQTARGDKMWMSDDFSFVPGAIRGLTHLDLGEYAQAEKELTDAEIKMIECIGKQKEPPGVFGWALLGPLGFALRPHEQSTFYTSYRIKIPGGLALAQIFQNHREKVDLQLEKVKLVITTSTQGQVRPQKFEWMAKIHMAEKDYIRALQLMSDPESDFRLFGFHSFTAHELPKAYIVSKSLLETGQVAAAKKGYDALLEHAQIRDSGALYLAVLVDSARIARSEGDTAKSEKLLREAIDVLERQRSSIPTDAGRIGFVGDKQIAYQELVSLLIDRGRAGEAFEYVERAKGRALVDLLASQKRMGPSSPVGERMEAVLTQMESSEQELSALPDPAEKKRSRTLEIVESLRNEIAAASPELASLVTVTRIPIGDIQDKLSADETLLEYYASGETWYAFVVTRSGVQVATLDNMKLASLVERVRTAATNPLSTDVNSATDALYRSIFSPVAGLIKTNRLTIVPHGLLHYVPFAALSNDGKYLIDQYSIRVLPSGSILKFLKGKKDLVQTLVLGNPDLGDSKFDLNFAQEEALSVAKTLPRATVLLRDKATASVVKSHGSEFDIIHFAGHGFFDAENPLNSALLLAKDKDSDGALRVGELYNLDLNADLVTLSACETALSRVANGDDVVGFTRGLLYAGSRSILSSLWTVDDQATRDLMLSFYEGLATKTKGEALRQAQLEVRKQHSHLYYWGAFVLTGNDQ